MGCLQSSSLGYEHYPQFNVDNIETDSLPAKVVLLGDSGVGKTSIAFRFCHNKFSDFYDLTIGAAFIPLTIRLQGGRQVKLHIWDTGGHERFRAMTQLYYRDAVGAVIVYDVGDAASFNSVKFWIEELRERGPPNCCIAVAGNKADTALRQVDKQEAKGYCDDEGVYFSETSAKSGLGISELFEGIANAIASKGLFGT